MALVTVLALLFSAVALGAYEVVTFRRALEQKLTVIADIVGRNCQVALAFGTPKDAGELLAALEAEPAVQVAAIYDCKGQVFASYNAGTTPGSTAPPLRWRQASGSRTARCRRPAHRPRPRTARNGVYPVGPR